MAFSVCPTPKLLKLLCSVYGIKSEKMDLHILNYRTSKATEVSGWEEMNQRFAFVMKTAFKMRHHPKYKTLRSQI